MNPTYDEILKAKSLQGNEIKKTPLIYSSTFSDLTNSEVYLKAEFRQKTGSFKIRGAYYKIKLLSEEEKKTWCCCCICRKSCTRSSISIIFRKYFMYNYNAKKCITCKSSSN
jgi:hypothetical protein